MSGISAIPIPGQVLDGPSGSQTIRLEQPLGSGAFGVVFKATDRETGSEVAVKFPQTAPFDSKKELQAFANEVNAAQEIQHPNVVQILYVNLQPAQAPPYLIMEFVGGGTLKTALDEARMAKALIPLEQVRKWMDQLVDGIEAINAKMLHRDLKPDNILIGAGGLKIGDFGLSKIVGAATRSRTFKGGQHILYMAPEGWKQETNQIQIDMYSMGIIFFEIASLAFPYDYPIDFRDLDGFRRMHIFQAPKDIRTLRNDIPVGVAQVIQRLLEKKASDRFKTWEEVKEALTKNWEPTPSQAKTSSPLVDDLLKEVTTAYQRESAEKLARELELTEKEEQKAIDIHQRGKLVASLVKAVGAFNDRSVVGNIRVAEELGSVYFRLPYGGSIDIHFFDTGAPVEVKGGSVRYFAWVRDSDGFGFNYLLVRTTDDDIYGTWRICRIRYNPLSGRHGVEPFGFSDAAAFREHMPWSKGAVHIFTYEFAETDPDLILELAVNAIRRHQRPN